MAECIILSVDLHWMSCPKQATILFPILAIHWAKLAEYCIILRKLNCMIILRRIFTRSCAEYCSLLPSFVVSIWSIFCLLVYPWNSYLGKITLHCRDKLKWDIQVAKTSKTGCSLGLGDLRILRLLRRILRLNFDGLELFYSDVEPLCSRKLYLAKTVPFFPRRYTQNALMCFAESCYIIETGLSRTLHKNAQF